MVRGCLSPLPRLPLPLSSPHPAWISAQASGELEQTPSRAFLQVQWWELWPKTWGTPLTLGSLPPPHSSTHSCLSPASHGLWVVPLTPYPHPYFYLGFCLADTSC